MAPAPNNSPRNSPRLRDSHYRKKDDSADDLSPGRQNKRKTHTSIVIEKEKRRGRFERQQSMTLDDDHKLSNIDETDELQDGSMLKIFPTLPFGLTSKSTRRRDPSASSSGPLTAVTASEHYQRNAEHLAKLDDEFWTAVTEDENEIPPHVLENLQRGDVVTDVDKAITRKFSVRDLVSRNKQNSESSSRNNDADKGTPRRFSLKDLVTRNKQTVSPSSAKKDNSENAQHLETIDTNNRNINPTRRLSLLEHWTENQKCPSNAGGDDDSLRRMSISDLRGRTNQNLTPSAINYNKGNKSTRRISLIEFKSRITHQTPSSSGSNRGDGSNPTRKVSLMELEAQCEKRWRAAYQSLYAELRKTHSNYEILSADQFLEIFKNPEVLAIVFHLFDWRGTGAISQDHLIDTINRRTGRVPGSREWSELIEVLAFVVCGEDGDITEELLTRILSSKGVLEKLFTLLSKEGDGANRKEIMDFIANLTYARPRTGFTHDNLEWLEKLFRQALGHKQELSFEDFKKIVNSRNSFFAERVFHIFDRDKNGTVSLTEFLGAMQQFAGKSPNDKFKFLFRVYDLDGDGLIQLSELQQVLQACMEENGMRFSKEQIEDLTLAMFEDADTDKQGEITYEELKAQLEKHTGLLENLSISIDRWLVPPKPTEDKKTFLIWANNLWPYQLSLPYMKNNYVYLSFLLLYLCVNIGLFISRIVEYWDSNGYTIVARACGQCLNFNCMFVLVLMLRQCITFLRTHGAGAVLPLDHHMYLHKMCGWFIFLYSLLHSLSHLLNFCTVLVYDTEPGGTNEFHCTLTELMLTQCPKKLGLVAGWANPTGIILLIILTVMVVCSQPFVRKSGYFEVFYWTHLLYIVFFTLTVLHAPNFWKWFVGPGVLFIIERTHRTISLRTGRGKTYINSGVLLPSKVINLVIQRPDHFHFHAGDYVFVNIPTIAKYEWHPFTLSSAPEQDGGLWLHIRAVGEWTNRLHAYFEAQQLKCGKSAEIAPAVRLASPADSPEYRGRDSLLMVGRDSLPMVAITEEGDTKAPTAPSTPQRKKAIINMAFENDNGELTNLPSTSNKSDDRLSTTAGDTASGSSSFSAAPPNKKPGPQKIQSTPNFFGSKPSGGKSLSRSASVPNFFKKKAKEERRVVLPPNRRRTTSERRFDRQTLDSAQQLATHETMQGARYLTSADRSVAKTFRYMRVKPTVITLDMPNDGGDLTSSNGSFSDDDIIEEEEEHEEGEKSKETENLPSKNTSKKHITVVNVEHEERKSNGHSSTTGDNTLTIPGAANESEAARVRRKSQQETRRLSRIESRMNRRISRLEEAEAMGQCIGAPLEIYIDGPYGTPSSHIFRAQHAVLIGTGIGVTPFASILQSIMHKYWKARHSCPKCNHSWTSAIPHSVMDLCKVDFFWINRDQRSFEWFVNLLSQLEIEQAEQGGVLDRFLDMHMYITSALQKTDMKAVGLQLALDLLHEKGKRDLITGLKTRTNAGRPNWDKVFKQLSSQGKGRITVFYCGPPALGRTLRYKCDEYGFNFRKENF